MRTKEDYQNELNWLRMIVTEVDSVVSDRALDILQELIDKNTPKKVIGLSINYEGLLGNCPYCNELVFEHQLNSRKITKVCQDCGQAIDWSKQ